MNNDIENIHIDGYDRPYQIIFTPGSSGHFIGNIMYKMLLPEFSYHMRDLKLNEYTVIAGTPFSKVFNIVHHEHLFIKERGYIRSNFEFNPSNAQSVVDSIRNRKIVLVDCVSVYNFCMALVRIKNRIKNNKDVQWTQEWFNDLQFLCVKEDTIRPPLKKYANLEHVVSFDAHLRRHCLETFTVNFYDLFFQTDSSHISDLYTFTTGNNISDTELNHLITVIKDYHSKNCELIMEYLPTGYTIQDMLYLE